MKLWKILTRRIMNNAKIISNEEFEKMLNESKNTPQGPEDPFDKIAEDGNKLAIAAQQAIMDEQDAFKRDLERVKRVNSFFDDVRAFHRKFDIGYDGPPRFPLDPGLAEFRLKRLQSEFREHLDAVNAGQPDGAFDGLIDLVYIALGTCDLHGWDFNEGWRRVHAANMRKVKADSTNVSKFGFNQDIVKPDGWTPPDLSDLVRETSKQDEHPIPGQP